MNEQKIEQFWRAATAVDIARMMKGDKVEARFRDKNSHEWTESGELLAGYDSTEESKWIDDTGCPWRFCQVYDPPQWWRDKPDPGEGWRLLEKFPDEPKLGTDEAWNPEDAKWQPIARGGEQEYAAWYRRRIEQNSPEKLDDSRSKDNIPNGWRLLNDNEDRIASDAYWSLGAKDWIIIGDARLESSNREKWPAIRQFENWCCMQLMEGCFYRMPNGQGIKVYKQGFEVL